MVSISSWVHVEIRSGGVTLLLVVCYTTAVLGMNAALVLCVALGSMYTRGLYGLAHVYIGHGQPVPLRIALGVIETLSGTFRAVSLSLRVVCNATAGHVLLAVLVEMTIVACAHLVHYVWM